MGQRYTEEGGGGVHTHSCSRGVELHTLCLSVRAAVTMITRPSPCSKPPKRRLHRQKSSPARLTRPREANPKNKLIQEWSRTEEEPPSSPGSEKFDSSYGLAVVTPSYGIFSRCQATSARGLGAAPATGRRGA